MSYQFRPQRNRRPGLELFIVALIWALLIFFSFLFDTLFWNTFVDMRSVILIALVSASAFISAILAILIERLLFKRRPLTVRFSAIFMLLTIGTGGASCLAVALYNLPFFLDDIAITPLSQAAWDLAFYTMASGYSFAASTARLFLPLGVVSLFLISAFYCYISDQRGHKNDY
ncbi:MAG: hypothetical protein ABJK39_12010 [Hyphomicrobiales bacterium]